MFRIKSIILACADSSKFDYRMIAIYSLYGAIFLSMFYVVFPKFYYRYDFKSQIFLSLSVYLITFILPNLIFSWLKNKNKLYEPENYFILIVFAVLTSVTFGMMSYGLQGVDSSSYIIDANLINEEHLAFKRKNQKDLTDARKNLQMIEAIYDKGIKNANIPVQLTKSSHNWFTNEYESNYKLGEIKIDFTKKISRVDRGVYVPTFHMELSCDTNKVSILPLHRIISKYPLPQVDAGKTVVAYLEKRKYWEIDVPLKQLLNDSAAIDKKSFNPSINIYIYDALMGVLGNNPGYFKPYSLLGRVIEILKTLFKFFYVSYFVSFLVKRYSLKE